MGVHIIVALAVLVFAAAQVQKPSDAPSLVESMLHLLMVDGARNVNLEPSDQRVLYKVIHTDIMKKTL